MIPRDFSGSILKPVGSEVFGDKAYNDDEIEDVLAEAEIHLIPIRKKNSHRPLPPWKGYIQAVTRKAVETAGSLIDRLKPLSIHAVTPEGFELKVVLFVLASSINCLSCFNAATPLGRSAAGNL
ncbi:hypothetical protein HYR99_05570 [Candidatus Poribacteria bacterium]|nr:hypothetical protein [Candidatus Poribacteria bacterium]